jgi:hypothetical protein
VSPILRAEVVVDRHRHDANRVDCGHKRSTGEQLRLLTMRGWPVEDRQLPGALPVVVDGRATTAAVLTAAKVLAQRLEFLEQQKRDLTAQLDALVGQINPALRAAFGKGLSRHRHPIAAHRRCQPASVAHRGLLRRTMRGGPGPGILGQNHPPPTSRAAVTAQPTMPCTASRSCA